MINENGNGKKELSLTQSLKQALLNLNKKGATICQVHEYEAIVVETLSVKLRSFRTSTKEVQQALINSYSHAILKRLNSARKGFERRAGVVTISINEAYFAYAEKKVGDMATLSVKQAGKCLAGNGRVVIDNLFSYSKKAAGILITPDPKAASKHNMVVAVHLENNAASGKGKLRQVAVDAKAAWNTIPLLRRERLNLENITSGILITDNKEKLLMLPNNVLPFEEKKKKKMGV